ncbi:oligosaccharide biosynthesis protein Alg14-like protein [Xylogone sp. PMI_703]|nr:oligosaccharide biosynthesis protein Alg14-like protein [Xylogone sp. PMI_703]
MVVLGSGGHTAEMISLIRDFDPKRYSRRTYIVSSGDNFSASKAAEFEARLQSKYRSATDDSKDECKPYQPGQTDPATGTWNIHTVPRARQIHQPLYTAPFSSFSCLIGCLRALYHPLGSKDELSYPDVIITNGPATAVIVILASFILKYLGLAPLWKMKIVYVESWARIKSLSLSGKILLWTGICDRFLVQWEELEKTINKKGKRKGVIWKGFLVD